MKVEECHSHGTVHIPMSCNLKEAAKQMAEQHVGTLIVTDFGRQERMVGIVTDRDIVLLRGGQNRERTGSVQTPLHV
ncbi:CBS domain-containing protein [Paraburkholderia sp. J8-2]|uniref:CBS domain-containing protein n=1 Tax=Paraburkholderia sp. J8-2 TaxID=2805440 RepID=UPI002AB5FA75|nr:CBS domain-containing protein [Paraburkholderia sp. J8-2]